MHVTARESCGLLAAVKVRECKRDCDQGNFPESRSFFHMFPYGQRSKCAELLNRYNMMLGSKAFDPTDTGLLRTACSRNPACVEFLTLVS